MIAGFSKIAEMLVLQRQHATPERLLLRIVSYCSDPSGDRVGPLVGVAEVTLIHCDRVAGHALTFYGHIAPIV